VDSVRLLLPFAGDNHCLEERRRQAKSRGQGIYIPKSMTGQGRGKRLKASCGPSDACFRGVPADTRRVYLLLLRLHAALRTQRATAAQPGAALVAFLRLRRAQPPGIWAQPPGRRPGPEPSPAHLGPTNEFPSPPPRHRHRRRVGRGRPTLARAQTVRKAVAEFAPSRPQRFQDLFPAKDVITELRQKRAAATTACSATTAAESAPQSRAATQSLHRSEISATPLRKLTWRRWTEKSATDGVRSARTDGA
jgi:hypothetical protein